MIEVVCYSFKDDCMKTYLRPSLSKAHENMRKTWGEQWDRIERERVTGGISTVWELKK